MNRFVLAAESNGSEAAAAPGEPSWPLSSACTLAAIEQEHPIEEAELLCRMFRGLGISMLPKLKGEFAFVIFDAKTVSAAQ